ncbi:MAG TPA: MmcB family DNA repair protein [Hyphomicrobiaceae bacterium]|nr:MmcB family DNA repair protein [Hyphomicrobiaceae bacterium]
MADEPTEIGGSGARRPDLELPADGRQSQRALDIAKGASRLLLAHGFARLSEVTLKSGRRADLVAIDLKSEIWIVEIKSSVADFRADAKWPDYRAYCDRFFFAVGPDFPLDILPDEVGIIVADRFGGELVRPAPEHKLAAARRKTVTLLMARVGALRLHALADPDIPLDGTVRE